MPALPRNSPAIFRSPYLLCSVAVGIYLLLRMIQIPVNYDESYTIRTYVPMSIAEILRFDQPSANNHLLNTILIRIVYAFGPDSLIAARLPNFLAGLLYLFLASKICRKYICGALGFSAFLLLVLNPFLLDFFSMARGYGLAFAFLLGACYFLIKYVEEKDQPAGWKSLGCAFLAVLSCVSLLNFWLILMGFFTLMPFLRKADYPSRRPLLIYAFLLFALTAAIWEPIRKSIQAGQLYYGGSNGLYSDTFVSVAKFTAYQRVASPEVIFWLNTFLAAAIIIVASSFYFSRTLVNTKNVLLAIFLLCLLAVVAQKIVLDTPYIIDRTALYLYPLLILVIAFSLRCWPRRSVAVIVAGCFVLLLGVNFFLRANFTRQALWFYDAHTPEILAELNEQARKENKKLLVGYGSVYSSSLQYYFRERRYSNLELADENQLSDVRMQDYHIHLAAPLDVVYAPDWDPVTRHPGKTVFRTYPEDQVFVYRISR